MGPAGQARRLQVSFSKEETIMNDSNPPSPPAEFPRPARNKDKLAGPKPPLRPGHVWSIRAKLQLERRTCDLAPFNQAPDLIYAIAV